MRLFENKWLLSLLSAILLSLGWHWGLSIFVFFGFVPLLLVEKQISESRLVKKKLKIFGFAYFTFLLWNIATCWWIAMVQFGQTGAVLAWLFNALLMSIAFLTFSNIKNRLRTKYAIWVLVPVWIAWEYLHSVWDLAWIWLDLSNTFSFNWNWVQWFEFTGSSGGTLWILILNVFTFQLITSADPNYKKGLIRIVAAITFPILISYSILYFEKEEHLNEPMHVVVVQPNIDPYNDKFVETFQPAFSIGLKLAKQKLKKDTRFLLLPETFITDLYASMNEEMLGNEEYLSWFKDSLLNDHPDLRIIVGANTALVYRDKSKITSTARFDKRSGLSYDEFNTALQLTSADIQVYHKSKLVPAVERMPFPWLFKPLEKLAIDLGGTSGSLGTQDERYSFSAKDSVGVAPVICYESVFSDYVTEYIRKGADFIFILTNDGWWGNSPGYVHHLNYARLRAIENRREIARSANTGVSCFIDRFGNTSGETPFWEEAVTDGYIHPNSELTFYTRFGDLLSYIAVVLALLLVVFSRIQAKRQKFSVTR